MKFYAFCLSLGLLALSLTSWAASHYTAEQLADGMKAIEQVRNRLDSERKALKELISRLTLAGWDREQIEELREEYENTVAEHDRVAKIYQDAAKELQAMDAAVWEKTMHPQPEQKLRQIHKSIDDLFEDKASPAQVEAFAHKYGIPLEVIAIPGTPRGLKSFPHEDIVMLLRLKIYDGRTWYKRASQRVEQLSDLIREKEDAGAPASEIAELEEEFEKAYYERGQAKSFLDQGKGELESFDRAVFKQLEEETDAGLLLRSTAGKIVNDKATRNAWERLFDEVDKRRAARAGQCADQLAGKNPKQQ